MTELKIDNFNGDNELYKFYIRLDTNTKNEIDNIKNVDVQMKTLKTLADPKIDNLIQKLPAKQIEKFREMNIVERVKMLQILEKKIEPKIERDQNLLGETKLKIMIPEGEQLSEAPEDIFEKDIEEEETKRVETERKTKSLTQKFEDLVQIYYQLNPYVYSASSNKELEVRFGTRGIKPLTKLNYDNVIRKLKNSGFSAINEEGMYRLSIQNEYINKISGKYELSSIRAEVQSLAAIQSYCKHNDLAQLNKDFPGNLAFTEKKIIRIQNDKIFPVNFDDFNFRVSLQDEISPKGSVTNFIQSNWKKTKKAYRYINRVTFTHPDFPVNVDLSIVKSSDRIGRNLKTYYSLQESDLFNKDEIYEIELEVDNKRVGPGTAYNNAHSIITAIRYVIKLVLSGLQGTNYPVSYPEQKQVLEDYMRLLYKKDYQPGKYIRDNNFIGPNSFVLKMRNICDPDENSNVPNIRNDFVVTDKADGERHLMFISDAGKIYLINTNMEVKFSGAKTNNRDLFNSLLDGELILHDKNDIFINLYAAFDIYYFNNFDVRAYTFMLEEGEKDIYKSRYMILKNLITILNPVSIVETSASSKIKTGTNLSAPMRFECKKFYPEFAKGNIFDACREIITKENENRFEYNTDGLIFSHAYFGVGANKIGVAGPLTKITWNYSFKWKPPQYNTVDFLVNVVKGPNNEDLVKSYFEDGINNMQNIQFSQYKTLELKTTFVPKLHGYINPCQDMIDGNFPEYKNVEENSKNNDALPVKFYPTEAYGDISPGSCNIMLKMDKSGAYQMFTMENELITDNMIVEFSYDINEKQEWRWKPLRVRYDKTAQLNKGEKQFGNAYHVANDIWDSIYNRITENMISTGEGIPDLSVSTDIYYNEESGKNFNTQSMKDFHNLYVKKMLIVNASKPGDTLIDLACGRAGDLPKWTSAKLSFVFGIDKSSKNLENPLNGACARYLNLRKQTKNMPAALFVNGNTSYNIKNGSAMLNDKAIQITKAIFGLGPKDPEKLGKAVLAQYGKGEDGFNISSCQFAIHYFLENPETLQGFLRNVAECTKLNGYFIGTAYDGKLVFNMLKNKKPGESIQIIEDNKKIWEIIKGYNSNTFTDNSSSIGYRIDVYQESINQLISEYLVNFDYLDRVFENYGFKLIDREEAHSLGFPEGSGLFSELFIQMLDEVKKNKFKEKNYGSALNMTSFEKKISFLNRYFIYKKVNEVNTEKVQLELSEYNEMDISRNKEDTVEAVEIAKEVIKETRPKVRKLKTKLLLVPGTEAMEDQPTEKVKTVKKKRVQKVIIEPDEE